MQSSLCKSYFKWHEYINVSFRYWIILHSKWRHTVLHVFFPKHVNSISFLFCLLCNIVLSIKMHKIYSYANIQCFWISFSILYQNNIIKYWMLFACWHTYYLAYREIHPWLDIDYVNKYSISSSYICPFVIAISSTYAFYLNL